MNESAQYRQIFFGRKLLAILCLPLYTFLQFELPSVQIRYQKDSIQKINFDQPENTIHYLFGLKI